MKGGNIMINQVIITGRIANDPEYAETIDVIMKKLSPHS